MDQMGEVEYAPGEPKGTPVAPAPGLRDGHLHDRRDLPAPGLHRGRRADQRRGHPVDDGRRGDPPHRGPPEDLVASGGLFHGIQLWVNLPRADKMVAPRYQDIGRSNVALLSSPDGGALLRVIAGDVAGHAGPGSTHSPMAMVHATLAPGARVELPWQPGVQRAGLRARGGGLGGYRRAPGPGPDSWPSSARVTRSPSPPTPTQEAATPDLDVLVLGGRPIRRAGLRLRAVRHEHPRGGGPGLRGLPGGPAGHGARRPHRVLGPRGPDLDSVRPPDGAGPRRPANDVSPAPLQSPTMNPARSTRL